MVYFDHILHTYTFEHCLHTGMQNNSDLYRVALFELYTYSEKQLNDI